MQAPQQAGTLQTTLAAHIAFCLAVELVHLAITHLHRPGLHFHQQQRAARRHDHHVDFTIMVMAAMHGVQGDAMKNFIPIR